MELMLTGVLAILTALMWWQSFFQNNVALFQKRMELYQNYAEKYHRFTDYAEYWGKHLATLNSSNLKSGNIKTKTELLKRFSDLEGVTSCMMFVGFSGKINFILQQNIDDARVITDFFTQTERRESKVSKNDVVQALDRLEDNKNAGSQLNSLFENELPLRNIKFYINKLSLKIRSCCKHKEEV